MKLLALAVLGLSLSGLAEGTLLTYKSFSGTKHSGALCNDGTFSGYYYKLSSTGSNVWVVHQQGGEWCYDKTSCLNRPQSLKSSNGWPSTRDVQGLFQSTDSRLGNANLIYVPYCTSDGYIGSNVYVSDFGFHFNGRQVVTAVFEDLIETWGMGSQEETQVLYSGCSAGGRGVMFNLEFVQSFLQEKIGPNLSNFGGLLDSPLWLDLPPYASSAIPLMTEVQDMFSMVVNSSQTLNPKCMANFSPNEHWKCLVAQYVLPFITDAPYLLHAYQYDAYQLGHNSNGAYPTHDSGLLAYAEKFRSLTQQTANEDTISPALPNVAALLPACYKHCNTEGSTFSTIKTNGQVSLEDATLNWFFSSDDPNSNNFVVEDCEGFNCGNGCPSV